MNLLQENTQNKITQKEVLLVFINIKLQETGKPKRLVEKLNHIEGGNHRSKGGHLERLLANIFLANCAYLSAGG